MFANKGKVYEQHTRKNRTENRLSWRRKEHRRKKRNKLSFKPKQGYQKQFSHSSSWVSHIKDKQIHLQPKSVAANANKSSVFGIIDTTRKFLDRFYNDNSSPTTMDFHSYADYDHATSLFGYNCHMLADQKIVIVKHEEDKSEVPHLATSENNNQYSCNLLKKQRSSQINSGSSRYQSYPSFQSMDVNMGLPESPASPGIQEQVDAMECMERELVPYTASSGDEYHNFSLEDVVHQDIVIDEVSVVICDQEDVCSGDQDVILTPSIFINTPTQEYACKWDSTPNCIGFVSQSSSSTVSVPSPSGLENLLFTPESLGPYNMKELKTVRCRDVTDFHILSWISKGSFGSVYKAADVDTGHIVAVKKVKLGITLEDEKQIPLSIFREIKIQWQCDHPNIVRLESVAAGKQSDLVYLIMEYVENDMATILSELTQPFTDFELRSLMSDLLQGLDYLHENNYMHRDLKPSNLLLNSNGVLKIADLGLARDVLDENTPEEDGFLTPIVVTLWYRAPEVLLGSKHYGKAVDLWSVGCILAEFISGKPLFSGRSDIDQLKTIFSILGNPSEREWPEYGDLPGTRVCTFPKAERKNIKKLLKCEKSTISDGRFDLIDRCLTYDPRKRLTCRAALEHEWFQDCSSMESVLDDSGSSSGSGSMGSFGRTGQFKVLMEKEMMSTAF